ncbi:P-loop containing nucleoside triphosphate hydrolase protein, partial [Mycena crocata]
MEAQQDKSKIQHFFRQGEMGTLLKACNGGLQEAHDVFKVQTVDVVSTVVEMQRYAEERHKEVLELIETLSDDSISDRASSMGRMLSGIHTSSTSISMLPSEPKIFHGRESELTNILKLFVNQWPRIAILGPGGIGKTSLARAILHHPQIVSKFEQQRFFVVCDSASTSGELLSLVAAHIGLPSSKSLTRHIIHFFESNPACLLVLDNLDTLWDPMESRGDIEEFLCLLTDVQHLALLITMRGAEKPSKVHWTHPFLPPLGCLTNEAAQQTFIDIADDQHNPDEIEQVLFL